MYCKKCGNQIDENSKFCSACGLNVENNNASSQNSPNLSKPIIYCTNCGSPASNSKKCICCGHKITKNSNQYCRYCGKAMEHGKCATCTMKNRQGFVETILRIIAFIFIGFSFCGSLIKLFAGNLLPALICFIIPLLLCIFVMRKKQIFKIKKYLNDKKITSHILILLYVLLSIIIVLSIRCSSLFEVNKEVDLETECKTIATEFAHEKLKSKNFKNPESLQIHDTIFDKAFANDDYYYYKIIVDYSAQNGFGGYNRDTFEVIFKVSKTTKKATLIEFDEFLKEYSTYVDNLTQSK